MKTHLAELRKTPSSEIIPETPSRLWWTALDSCHNYPGYIFLRQLLVNLLWFTHLFIHPAGHSILIDPLPLEMQIINKYAPLMREFISEINYTV